MLSPYRVIDATDHRGQIAGMILAGLGAEVLLLEPPGGSQNRKRDVLEWRAYNRGKHSVVRTGDDVDDLLASADILLDNGQFDRAAIAERFPHLVHVSVTAFGGDGPTGHPCAPPCRKRGSTPGPKRPSAPSWR
jgi:crotonobetainyl-CoA:carnitine CoA-transferase CaiB-like acyl-CoA transferase